MTEELLNHLRQAVKDKRRRYEAALASGDHKRKQIKNELLELLNQLAVEEDKSARTT